MIDFHSFETFDPTGPGLGNLFGQISPLTALGIWPSGDFRLAPGDGAVPAAVYYLGAAFAMALLFYGLGRAWRARERAILASAIAVAALYAAARLGGTPYTAAKALEIAAPILTLTILLPLAGWRSAASPAGGARLGSPPGEGGVPYPATGPAGLALLAYVLAAGGCSLLAFANAPVGPTTYSPALTGLRPVVGLGPTEVLVPARLLDEEHGLPYVVWELRGGRVCVTAEEDAGESPTPGVRFVIAGAGNSGPPFPGLTLKRRAGPYLLWERHGPVRASPCPLIAVRQARQSTP